MIKRSEKRHKVQVLYLYHYSTQKNESNQVHEIQLMEVWGTTLNVDNLG